MTASANPPKVFISYSHDSIEHQRQVMALADRLCYGGIDCKIDQYEMAVIEGWQRWMLDRVRESNFVLLVCSEQYKRRFEMQEEPGKGRGVIWEARAINQELYDDQGRNDKFIPITLKSEDKHFIPSVLRDVKGYYMQDDNGYELLYRRLTNQPKSPQPSIGSIQPMPPSLRPEQKTCAVINSAAKLAGHLCNLNYREQSIIFKDNINGLGISQAFLIKVDGEVPKRWLEYHLFSKIPENATARRFSRAAKSAWNDRPQIIWESLFGVETLEEALEKLNDEFETSPLVITIHDIEDLKPETFRLIRGFWENLLAEINSRNWPAHRESCILLMTQNNEVSPLEIEMANLTSLPPCNILTGSEVMNWLQPEVEKLLSRCSSTTKDAFCENLIRGRPLEESLGPPETILPRICREFNLDGAMDLIQFWR